MPKRERMLGSVQLVILFLVSEKGRKDTSGTALQVEVEQIMNHPISIAQVHIALRRLKERGLLIAGTVPRVGNRGRPKHKHILTPDGEEALAEYMNIVQYIAARSST